jgi:PAS domain S-box-containing protein
MTNDSTPNEQIHKDRYRAFIDNVADGFYETDLRGRFNFFNKALCRIFGYLPAELQNRNFREFMDQKNARLAFESFNKVFRTGNGLTDIRWEIIRKDGGRRFVEISANLIFDDSGHKIGFRGIARDISDKFIAQQALRESEQRALLQYRASRNAEKRYRGLLDFLPDPVIVFNLDSTCAYLNPAFTAVFGWTREELKGKRIPFVPDFLKEETRQGIRRLFRDKVVHSIETRRLTKDGRLLDILLDVAIFYGENNEPAGQIAIFRNITSQKRVAGINQAIFRIASALPRFQVLDELLEFITKEVKDIAGVEGASVILIDEAKKEFFFRVASYEDVRTGKLLKELRFPLDKGVAGHVYRTGQPMIVPDTARNPFFLGNVDARSGYKTRSMLDVPISTREHKIGVLCAVNKKQGEFDNADAELLSAIASTVALPIENTAVNEALKRSYKEVRSLNRAKERVIHHLSHELKTPLSVLDASLGILKKKLSETADGGAGRILERAGRNLDRILEMQYEIEDILKEDKYRIFYMLSTLLDVCKDELETLFEEQISRLSETMPHLTNSAEIENSLSEKMIQKIQERIEKVFGPREAVSQEIRLDHFIYEKIDTLRPRFAHRNCHIDILIPHFEFKILMPPEVLEKMVEGLLRNAVENTPDSGRIEICVRNSKKGIEFEVRDFGVGITEENQRLIFENIFTTRETLSYSSGKPYYFNAGGKGFDLLRMKIFSERYHFNIRMISERCRFIPRDEDVCPGKIEDCPHCKTAEDCFRSGGTRIIVRFDEK